MKLLIPPPVVAVLAGLALWGLAALWPDLRFAFPFQRVIAGLLIALGLALDVTAALGFRKAKTTVSPLSPEKSSSLVVSGLYRFTRNPMYLGLLLILTGVSVLLGTPLGIGVLIAFVVYITAFQIKPEEERLEAIFGEEYRRYTEQVRRWI